MELEQIKAAYQELEQKFDELQKNQNHLVESEKLAVLSKFVSDMAHHINNPLMVISGRAQLSLMDGVTDEEIKANFEVIREQCIRLKHIIRKLLVFAKPHKGAVRHVNINALLEEVVKSFQAQGPLENITIEKSLSPALSDMELDEQQIYDVFINLMQNSVEAMPEGGRITISSSMEGRNVRIDVQDTGHGIGQEEIKKIFDPFFTTKEKGAGLGLSMCYGVIKEHGGELRYESVPNQGTTATIVLPIESEVNT